MEHLFRIVGRLFGAKRKVKLLAAILLMFSASSGAQTKQDYGPYVIEQTALWLPDYLEAALLNHFGYVNFAPPEDPYKWTRPEHRRKIDLLLALRDLSYRFRRDNFVPQRSGRIQFRGDRDKIFDLLGKPPRMAVTGTAFDSKVIFNLDLISDATKFSFADALALWIHELGHKLPAGDYTQEEIDTVAGMFSRWYAGQMEIFTAAPGFEILVINPIPYSREGDIGVHFQGIQTPIPSLFAVLQGTDFFDFSEQLNAGLDRFAHPLSNIIETKRPILAVVKLKENPLTLDLRLELRTARMPKNMNHYVFDEMGPNHHKSARVSLRRDLKGLSVSHYVNEPAPRPMITDAEAEISEPAINAERKQLSFTLRLKLKNETHFHAASYPEARFTVHALLDGEPVRLEGKISYLMDKGMGGMPHEVHKTLTEKTGRVTVDIAELRGTDLGITGMQDRFFTLGRGYEGPEEEQKRVHIRESLSFTLSTCQSSLMP